MLCHASSPSGHLGPAPLRVPRPVGLRAAGTAWLLLASFVLGTTGAFLHLAWTPHGLDVQGIAARHTVALGLGRPSLPPGDRATWAAPLQVHSEPCPWAPFLHARYQSAAATLCLTGAPGQPDAPRPRPPAAPGRKGAAYQTAPKHSPPLPV